MIILFDEAEKDFTSLGLGILRDAIECTVEEKLNDTFELSLSYPTIGANYSKIRIGRIIYAKPNPFDNQQPFRIYSMSRPINGIVTISAQHISYDMNGIPCKAVDAMGLNDALSKIQNGAYINHNFTLSTNIYSAKTFKTSTPYNMRALLMGDDEESLLGVFDGEVKFDKFNAMIYSKRGKDRGAQVSYGYNMTDLTHETNTDLLYNGVFPYYHKETTSSETTTEDTFTQVYVVGTTPFVDGWLSYTKNGEAYHPLDATPVQIATEGDYYQKVYAWDSTYQKFVEKLYNQTVTLIEGVTEPTWIVIDWSTFPTITCRANAKGYFKLSTDEKWSDEKGVGDTIFQGNILSSGLSGMASNLILYYSEVVPSGAISTTKEISEVTEVILDDPIIKLSTADATSMKYDRILNLDLTSEFDEEPSKDALRTKAEEYISEHKVGTVKHNTTVSFVDLETTTEADKYKNFDHIELGDTVRVVYKDLGVDVQLRAITTSYNVISNRYNSVELGEKEDSLSSQSIQNGDSISSLTNDAGYTDITTVNKLIAKTVTAEYIQSVNAKLSKAQIEDLTASKINCSGIIEATQFTLDELVAKLLTAENAKVSNTLEAGAVKVAGDITVNSGQISINGENGTSFNVDRDGNVKANSVEITGGNLNINDGAFEVTNEGVLTARAGQIGDCMIDENGSLRVSTANIDGTIYASGIEIKDKNGDIIMKADSETPDETVVGGFSVDTSSLKSGLASFDDMETEKGFYIGTDGIKLGQNFYVDAKGSMYSDAGQIGGFTIKNESLYSPTEFNSLDATDTYKKEGTSTTLNTQGVYISPKGFRIGVNAKEFFDSAYNNKAYSLSMFPKEVQISSVFAPSFESAESGEYYVSTDMSKDSYSYYILCFTTTRPDLNIYVKAKNVSNHPATNYGVISKVGSYLSHLSSIDEIGRIDKVTSDDSNNVAKSYKDIETSSLNEGITDTIYIGKTDEPGTYFFTVKHITQTTPEYSIENYLRIYSISARQDVSSVKWIDEESDVHHGGIYSDKYGQVTIVNGQFHGLLRGLSDSVIDTYTFKDGSIYYNDKLIFNKGSIVADATIASVVKLKYDSSKRTVYSDVDKSEAVIPYATASTFGLVKSGLADTNNNVYAVDFDNGGATVAVPWENDIISDLKFETDSAGNLVFSIYSDHYIGNSLENTYPLDITIPSASTSTKGVVQLGDATGTSTDKAATVNLATSLYRALDSSKMDSTAARVIYTTDEAVNTKAVYTAFVPSKDGAVRLAGQSIVFAKSTTDTALDELVPGGIAIIDE